METTLFSLGSFIRAARMARGLTQQKTAKEAHVSRRQLAILEQGGNVSVQFLLKIANYLRLTTLPIDGRVKLVSGRGGFDLVEFSRALDLMEGGIEYLRFVAMTAALPPTEQATLKDTPAVMAFVERHVADRDGLVRLEEAIRRLSMERAATPPAAPEASRTEAVKRRRQKA